MWYVYGRLLYENVKDIPQQYKSRLVTEWVSDWKNQLTVYPCDVQHSDVKKGDLIVWRNQNLSMKGQEYRLRVAYIEDIIEVFREDSKKNKIESPMEKVVLISEAGLTMKGNANQSAYILPGVKYLICTEDVQFYHEDFASPVEGELHKKFDILEIVKGPLERTEEKVVDSVTKEERLGETYNWYYVKDANDYGWVRLEDYNRSNDPDYFNTEFNLQGIDLEPHPIYRYWSPVISKGNKHLGDWPAKVLKISK